MILPQNKFPFIPQQVDPDPGPPVVQLPPGVAPGPGPAPQAPFPLPVPPNDNGPPPPWPYYAPPDQNLPPYDLLRKLYKTFGMDALAADSFDKRIAADGFFRRDQIAGLEVHQIVELDRRFRKETPHFHRR